MFICEIWLFVWYFPQFCTSDMSKYGFLSVSAGPFDFEITRVDCSMQGNVSIMDVWRGWKNLLLGVTVRHHSASLVMPISDPRDRFFYPHHTSMKNSYSLRHLMKRYSGYNETETKDN